MVDRCNSSSSRMTSSSLSCDAIVIVRSYVAYTQLSWVNFSTPDRLKFYYTSVVFITMLWRLVPPSPWTILPPSTHKKLSALADGWEQFQVITFVIVREYVFFVFFSKSKKRDFLRFFEVTCQKNIENVFQVSESWLCWLFSTLIRYLYTYNIT